MNTIELTGYCTNCSFPDSPPSARRYVFHPSPWCPKFPAVAIIDSNSDHWIDDGGMGHYEPWTLARHISRPVEVGELVLLVDLNDGPDRPFATWGRVKEGGRIVTFDKVAENNRYLYVDTEPA